jgi:hypothetical protein
MFDKKRLDEAISTTLYDLTHLEINTIIKDEMTASKAPASPRLLLHNLAGKYDLKLVTLGDKYAQYLGSPSVDGDNLFRGKREKEGSGYESFKELSVRSKDARMLLKTLKPGGKLTKDIIDADMMMLQRIETISGDIRRILVMDKVDPVKDDPVKLAEFNFDEKETIEKFRSLTSRDADKYELNLDLRQLLVIKKANDIGTEKVVLQTVIGMDGDVTTRISKAFAEQPVAFINEMHRDAIGISVEFWKTLINVVVKLGTHIVDLVSTKK